MTTPLHEELARYLAVNAHDVMFGLIGDANLFMVDSYVHRSGGRFIAVAQESAAVLAAIAYSRLTGRVGVATVTHGPAFTNTVTALVEASKARVPIVLIAGDTPSDELENLQDVDQPPLARAAGASVVIARSPARAIEDLHRAFALAVANSGPVVFDVPVGFMWEQIVPSPLPASPRTPPNVRPSDDALEGAVEAILAARRPLVVGGRGATGARDDVALLANRLGAPLMTSLGGKGLFAGHPGDRGVLGTLSDPAGAATIGAADCVIAFGAGLNRFTTMGQSLLAGKTVIAVTTDPRRLRADPDTTIVLRGDAGETARALLRLIDEVEAPPTRFREHVEGAQRQEDPPPTPIQQMLGVLERGFPRDRVLVTDGGRFLSLAWQGLSVPEPRLLVPTVSFGSIGLGIGHAIGAAVAEPTRPTLLVAGDGGLMLGGLMELSTFVRHSLNLTIVVLNDGGYGAEYVQFEARGMDPSLSLQAWPDFARVVEAFGGHGWTVSTVAELEAALEGVPSSDGAPSLIDIRLDPATIPTIAH